MAPFKPALIVVDFQEDFCPPNGSLAVTGGRDIAPVINDLMKLPFNLKVATQDWHPPNHISFASQHKPPNNKPFESTAEVANPLNSDEKETIRLWPDHCIQNSPGAQFIPEFDTSTLDAIVQKGQDQRVEMYSAFQDTYTSPVVAKSSLSDKLKQAGITDVYVVGLARDYCVRYTALHAAGEGYQTYVIEEAVRAVDSSEAALAKYKTDMADHGVVVTSIKGKAVEMVRDMPPRSG